MKSAAIPRPLELGRAHSRSVNKTSCISCIYTFRVRRTKILADLEAIGNLIDLGVKRYTNFEPLFKIQVKIKKSETYREACPYLGLFICTTLGVT
jgi:hypothetical protein